MRTWLQNLWQQCRIVVDEATTRTLRAAGETASGPAPLRLSDLEPRILFSATPLDPSLIDGGDAQPATVMQIDQTTGDETDNNHTATESSAGSIAASKWEIVFIDAAVPQLDQMLDDLSRSGRDLQVVVLQRDRDGIDQINEVLESHRDVTGIHIISHAENGAVRLGNLWLSESNLDGYAGQLTQWQSSLRADADILLYGCDLADSANGRALIESLSALTGAQVAASDDTTGHADYGGDWDLEFRTGAIETGVAFGTDLQAAWYGKLATFTVTNTNNNGSGSLRQAILDANAAAGADTILFNIPITDTGRFYYRNDSVAGTLSNVVATTTPDGSIADFDPDYPGTPFTWFRINLTSALPTITGQVTIDGLSQSGASANTLVTGNDAILRIEINGSAAGGSADGFSINGGANTIVRGFVLNGFGGDAIDINGTNGVRVESNFIGTNVAGTVTVANTGAGVTLLNAANNTIGGTAVANRNVLAGNGWGTINIDGAGSTGNLVQGNYIGTNAAGTAVLTNNRYNGIWIAGGASNNTVGGTTAVTRNVISGYEEEGIEIEGSSTAGNIIRGNYIGTNAGGTAVLGNGGDGIAIENAINTIIGGSAAGAGNLIGGNTDAGIALAGNSSSGTQIQGNWIGTDSTGTLNLGNAGSGIHFSNTVEGASGGATNNTVGGTLAGEGNLIAFNTGNGVKISSTTATSNTILGNLIYSNTALGIDLGTAGITGNDGGDGDGGANRLQNFPVLSSATTDGGSITINGTLNSATSRNYRIEYFANSAADASGNGEGQRYLGFSNVTTNGSGNATLAANLTASVAIGEFISATATDLTSGDTSEFAQNITAVSTVSAVPVISLPGGSPTYTLGDPLLLIDTTATVSDADSADFDTGTLTVSITSNASADDRLEIQDGGTIQLSGSNVQWRSGGPAITIGTFSGGTNGSTPLVVNLNANATAARTQDLLRAIGYRNASVTAPSYSVTTQFVLADGDGGTSAAQSKVINISGANQPPVNTVPGPQNASTNTPLVFSTANGNVISTSDPDAGGGPVEVTLTATNGSLTLNHGGGLASSVGNEVLTNSFTANTQSEPAIARAANGNYVIAWSGYRNASSTNEVFFQLHDASGATLVIQTIVNSTTANVQSQPDVAIDNNGNFVVVWTSLAQDNVDGKAGIYAQRFNAAGTAQGGEFLVHTVTLDQQEAPAVAMDSDGDFVVVWTDKIADGDGDGVFARRFNAAGTAQGGQFQVNTTTVDKQLNPDVAIDANGNFVVVWDSAAQDSGDGQTGVYARRFDANGVALSGEVLVNTTTVKAQEGPAIAMNASGTYVITWTSKDTDGSGRGIFGQLYDNNGNAVGPTEFQVNTFTTLDQAKSAVAIDAGGSFAVVWESANQDNPGDGLTGVYLQQFDSSGNPVGSERRVNTTVAGSQSQPAIVMDSDGDIVVVWDGNGAGDASGVFHRRYNNATEIAFTTGDGVGDATMTFTGTVAEVNALLDGMTFTPTTNYSGAASVTLAVNDLGNSGTGGAKSDSDVINITIIGNSAPVITSDGGGANAVRNVAENTTAVTTVTATDSDLPAQTLTYSIFGGADAAKFTINGSTGALSFNVAPDHETPTDAGVNNTYNVIVQVSDGTLTDTQAIAVTVTAANDNTPVITSDGGGPAAAVNVAENSTAVTTVTATDADLPGQSLTYSISGGADAGEFTINSSTGVLTFIAAPDRESPTDAGGDNVYNVTVQVSDGTLSDTQAIAVTVTAANDNTPVITSDGGGPTAAVNAAENTTAVTTVTATDADLPGQTLTYSISGGADAGKFSINNGTGALEFILTPDFETPADTGGDNVYDVTVQVSDGTLVDTQAVAVTVTDVIEGSNSPPVVVNDNYTISEDGSLVVVGGWFDPAWSMRQKLTINNAAQGQTFTNFPLLIKLDSTRIDYSRVQNTGQDLRFVDADGTVLAHEIENWNESGTSTVWVRVSQVDAASAADFIWMYYDNAAAADNQNSAAVWANGYAAVSHLDDDFSDATGNGNTGVNSGSSNSGGNIADGQQFNGGTGRVIIPASGSINNVFDGGGTVSVWINPSSSGQAGAGHILDKSSGANGWSLSIDNNKRVVFHQEFSLTSGTWVSPNNSLTQNQWQLVSVVYNDNSSLNDPKIYINGVAVGVSGTILPLGFAGSDAGNDLAIGNRLATANRTFHGSIDEVRIETAQRSADWQRAQYLSMTDAMVNFGAVEENKSVLANDTDVDNDSLTAILVGGNPANAQSFSFNPDGSFSYTPNANYAGVDTFTYKVNDGTVDSNLATVSITVTAVNDAPTVGGATLPAIAEDTLSPGGATVADLFGGSFADVDAGSSLSGAVVVGNAANATTEGRWQYSSDSVNWYNVGSVNDSGSGLAIAAGSKLRFVSVANYNGVPGGLTIRALDDSFAGAFSTTAVGQIRRTVNTSVPTPSSAFSGATVALVTSITAVNDAPTLAAHNTSTDVGVVLVSNAAVFASLSNDVESDPLTATLVSGPSNGSLVLNPDGSFIYTPDAGFSGLDSFRWQAFDGTDSSLDAVVQIQVGTPAPIPLPTPIVIVIPPSESDPSQPADEEVDDDNDNGNGDGDEEVKRGDTAVNPEAPPSLGAAMKTMESAIESENSPVTDASSDSLASPHPVAITSPVQNQPEGNGRSAADSSVGNTRIQSTVDQSAAVAAMSAVDHVLMTRPGAMWNDLDSQLSRIESQIQGDLIVVGTAGAAASSFTVGVVAWALRTGFLASGLLAQMPAWRAVDPLLVMQAVGSGEGDDETLEELMQRQTNSLDHQEA